MFSALVIKYNCKPLFLEIGNCTKFVQIYQTMTCISFRTGTKKRKEMGGMGGVWATSTTSN